MNITDCLFEERVSAWVDGQLTAADEMELVRHLANCDACKHALETFRLLDGQIRDAHMPARPVPLPQSLSAAGSWSRLPHRNGQRAGGPGFLRRRFRGGVLAGGMAVAVAGLAAVIALSTPPSSGRVPNADRTAGFRDVVAPLTRMAASNEKSRKQQKYLARNLELQLRVLKLKTRNSGGNAVRLRQLESDIDQLIGQLKRQDSVPAESASTPAL